MSELLVSSPAQFVGGASCEQHESGAPSLGRETHGHGQLLLYQQASTPPPPPVYGSARAGAVDRADERPDAAIAGGDHVPSAAAGRQDSRVSERAVGCSLVAVLVAAAAALVVLQLLLFHARGRRRLRRCTEWKP